jgi:hypothetical protein
MRVIYILLAVLLLSSCATRKINTSALTLGISKEQATKALRVSSDGVIYAKQEKASDKKFEILQFSQYEINQTVLDRYWLIFVDDRLVQWQRALPGQKPDMTIEMNVNKL